MTYPPEILAKMDKFERLASLLEFEMVDGEVVAPWVKFPRILLGSIGWRMGAGEQYLHDIFYPYWRKLSMDERDAYLKKFDLGAEWDDGDKWRIGLNKIFPNQ